MEYLDPATRDMKQTSRWRSERLEQEVEVVRWGHYGVPLLLFPTAGGDAEEVERFFLVKVLEPLIHGGRIKVYSVDSLNGRTWLTNDDVAYCVWMHRQFDAFVRHELVPLIRNDCQSAEIEIMTAGASIGALNALIAICRHPRVFSRAICMSGTYDLRKWLGGKMYDDFYQQSPLMFVPDLPDGEQLQQLRARMVLLATGTGKNEDPGESWNVSRALGGQGIPNRVDQWDESWEHDWVTWRKMLPGYVEEMLESPGSPGGAGDSPAR